MDCHLMQDLFSVFKTVLITSLLVIGIIGCSTQSPTVAPRPLNKVVPIKDNKFMVLCYHDIPTRNTNDIYAVNIFTWVKEIEYMRDHGCHFIGVKDILAARAGIKPLPDNAVMLTFDDGYESFYKNVFPMLKLYKIPALLAIVTSWIDDPAQSSEYGKLMTWQQIKEVSDSPYVDIASHSLNSHRAVEINPQGGTAPAFLCRVYNPKTGEYESEAQYRERLYSDLSESRKIIKKHTGKAPVAVVWPFGAYTGTVVDEARKAGYTLNFSLDDGVAQLGMRSVPRYMLMQNVKIDEFVRLFKLNFMDKYPMHEKAIQVDLDLVYDEDTDEQNRNIDKLIERIYRINPTTVYLQAFSDDKADGNISSVYFPNRVLPMKADLFSRVARSLSIRGFLVYAWMPTLSIKLPDEEENSKLRIREFKDNKIRISASWYTNRLSPFSPEAVSKLETLYEDMAANAPVDGVIFQDDGYLNDFEDYSDMGRQEFFKISGNKLVAFKDMTPEQKQKWTELKTDKLLELTDKLKAKVLYQRQKAVFARTIYAPVLTEPFSEEWFAQNYKKCLEHYDFTVVMSYPEMEKIRHPAKWFRKLVQAASKYPDGIRKTVFKVQSYNWSKKRWIPSREVAGWLHILLEAGAWNIAYYPDDYTVNEPKQKIISRVISDRDFPEKEDWKK